MPSQRQIRFGEVIRSIISDSFIREDFYDSNIDVSKITVSFVKMSKDLRDASVYVTLLGGKNKDEMIKKYWKVKEVIMLKAYSPDKLNELLFDKGYEIDDALKALDNGYAF